jgi:hypothetical protein
MRGWPVLLALALAAAPARAATPARPPDILLVVCSPSSGTDFGNSLAAMAEPVLAGYGLRVHQYNVLDATPGRSMRMFGQRAFLDDEWGRSTPFDGVVILGADWKFVTNLRVDSLTFAPCYPDVPVLAVGTRGGWVTATPDSTGATPGTSQFSVVSTAASLAGTRYRIGQSVGNGESGQPVVDGQSGITRLLVCPSGGDTCMVWRKQFPADGSGTGSITFVTTANGGINTLRNQFPALLLGVASFVAQLPDSVRPRPLFPLAYHVDDGCKRNDASGSGGIQPDQYANMAAAADSSDALGIKRTLGVECSSDTLNTVDADGRTRWANFLRAWDSPNTKFTPHVHAGVDAVATSANDDLSGHFNDLFGASRNRVCDPTAAMDTTLYWNCKVALDTLAARVGSDRIDHTVMPATDDYSPLNINSASCTLEGMLASYRRAGFRRLRINVAPASNLASGGSSDPSGYYSSPGLYPATYGGVDYGDIGLLAVNFDGYLPGLGAADQTAESASQRAGWCSDTFCGYFVGRLGLNLASVGQAGLAAAPSWVIVNHIRNYGGAAPGWQVVRDVNSVMEALNAVAGYAQWQWVWSEQLNPRPPGAP